MEADSQWALDAPHDFDRALIRNAFMYELSRQVGLWALRTRFCEVFVHTAGTAAVTLEDYAGVYVLTEASRSAPHRVDVEELSPDAIDEPDIGGGYIFKIGRPDPGDAGFSAFGQVLQYVEPEERDISIRSEQVAWVRGLFNAMVDAFRTEDRDLYSQYINVESWIDHHLLHEFAKDPDASVLSTYLHKDRDGVLEMGPIWDFDRAMGPDKDGRSADPEGWTPYGRSSW